MCQSNYLEISRSALRKNAAAVCKAVQEPVIGIVKCNGYGVTVCEAAAAWKEAGACMLGVSRPEEALTLRQAGFREEILLLCPVADKLTLEEMLEHNIILTVTGLENACFYSMFAPRYPVRVHVAIDTGMGRFGICWCDTEQARAVYDLSGLSFEGIFSHFSCAFESKYRQTKQEMKRFLHMTQFLQAEGCHVGMRHIANSCAATRFSQTRLDAVRIGSALVGKLPVFSPVKLETVGIFKAQVVDIKHFSAGDTTGYGGYCRLKKNTKAAVIALGREDGFGTVPKPDHLRLRDLMAYLRCLLRDWMHPPCVTYQGKKLKMIGRIGNQYTLFDTADTLIQAGDYVEWDGNLLLSSCERRFV